MLKMMHILTGWNCKVKFDGRCLKQDTGLPFHGGILNVYIVYKMSKLNSKMK